MFRKSSNPKVRGLAQDYQNLARVNEVAVYVRGAARMSVPTVENAEARIRILRDRAEQIRTDAAQIRQERIRASMLKIASSYDKMADSLTRFLAKKDQSAASVAIPTEQCLVPQKRTQAARSRSPR